MTLSAGGACGELGDLTGADRQVRVLEDLLQEEPRGQAAKKRVLTLVRMCFACAIHSQTQSYWG